MESVSFITTQSGVDLVVSFAIYRNAYSGQVDSLTLIRSPKYEVLLPEYERGTTVSFDRDESGGDLVLLLEIKFLPNDKLIVVRSDKKVHELDLSKVAPNEIKQMQMVFEKMNFDSSIFFTVK
jgi:hypothetical protein